MLSNKLIEFEFDLNFCEVIDVVLCAHVFINIIPTISV